MVAMAATAGNHYPAFTDIAAIATMVAINRLQTYAKPNYSTALGIKDAVLLQIHRVLRQKPA